MTAIPRAPEAPAPAALAVSVDEQVRVLDRGRVLLGGVPFRVVWLTNEGAHAIVSWSEGAPVGEGQARRRLARSLLDAGILASHASTGPSTTELTVVVPVRDRLAQLSRCLEAISAACPGAPVVVVDDGSADAAAVGAACADRGASVVRHAVARGAAAARNSGLAAASTEYVAFIDSDVVVSSSWSEPLLAHFADPCVGAAAPRVVALSSPSGIVAGYEARHSALDMGPTGGLVAPGHPTSYVPSAALLVRRQAIGAGFDESLQIGEDVDLVWRMAAAGWRVIYDPRSHVRHDHRLRLRAFASRRRLYARSVAILARRHPEALPATRISPWMAVPWALALTGRPRVAACTAAAEALLLGRRLRGLPGRPYRVAGGLVGRGLLHTGLGLARAARRAWAPPLAVLAIRLPAARLVLPLAFAVAIVEDALATRDPRAVVGDVPMRLLDEAIALAGTWEGCVRERTARPLLPTWRMTARPRQDAPVWTGSSSRP